MMNILLLGRKKWSVLALEYLLENDYNIIGVVGKSKKEELDGEYGTLTSLAEKHHIPVYNYKEIYELIDPLSKTFDGKNVDIVVSYLFWGKLKKELLNIAKVAPINFHPAPLPEYQGLGGYNAAIMDEADYYGVSAHIMSENIDAGDILKVNKFYIEKNETAYSLEQKSMQELLNVFKEIFSNNFDTFLKNKYKNQVGEGRYINKSEFENMKFIEEHDSQEIIDKKIRAFWYPPYEGAKIKMGDKYYTVIDSRILQDISRNYHK